MYKYYPWFIETHRRIAPTLAVARASVLVQGASLPSVIRAHCNQQSFARESDEAMLLVLPKSNPME